MHIVKTSIIEPSSIFAGLEEVMLYIRNMASLILKFTLKFPGDYWPLFLVPLEPAETLTCTKCVIQIDA